MSKNNNSNQKQPVKEVSIKEVAVKEINKDDFVNFFIMLLTLNIGQIN